MGASDFSKLPHIGESLRRKEDYRFLTGAGQRRLRSGSLLCDARIPQCGGVWKSQMHPWFVS